VQVWRAALSRDFSCPKMVTSVTERPFRMGLEGIVSKRTDAPYRSGPSKTWVKSKNPASEAMRREHEEEVALSRIAQLDQRTALPDQCLHSAEADVRPPKEEVRV